MPVSGGGGEAVGIIIAWSGAGSSVPTGYLLCDGSAVSRTTYSGLFAAIGTIHGTGDGSSTFNLPNLVDKFIVGATNSTGDNTYPGVSPGATGGAASDTQSITVTGTTGFENLQTGANHVSTGSLNRRHTHDVTSTGSVTVNTLPPYYALCYVIKVFDARSSNVTIGPAGPTGATGPSGPSGPPGGSLDYCNLKKSSLTENINVDGVSNAVVVGFDSEVSKAAIYTHSNSTNPGRVTVTSTGFFMINATIGYDNTGANRVSPRASLFKNGTEISETRASSYSRGASYGDEKAIQINTVLELTTSDFLEVYAWADQRDQTDAANTVVGECEFVLSRISTASGITTTSTSTDVTLIGDDTGKLKIATGTGNQFTVAANVFNAGDYVSFYNDTAAVINILVMPSVTIFLSGSNVSVTSGAIKLSPRGLATMTCVFGKLQGTSSQFVISGGGVYI